MPSIIIPSYNEEETIGNTLKELETLKENNSEIEIIVVDDGSQDKTKEKSKKADKVISYKPNQGKGHAMRKGVENAEHEEVIFTDADQHHIEKLPLFLQKLEENTMVIGKRNFKKIPWPRRINIALTKLAVFLATGRIIKDPICGIRAIHKKSFQELNLEESGFEIESEINLKALKKKMKIKYVPIEIEYPDEPFEFNELNWRQSKKLATYLITSVLKSWTGKL